MLVNLVKEANFEFDESKYKAVDKEVFDMLIEPTETKTDAEADIIVFNDKNEYQEKSLRYSIDEQKPIYVNAKKQIFCFLKK